MQKKVTDRPTIWPTCVFPRQLELFECGLKGNNQFYSKVLERFKIMQRDKERKVGERKKRVG